MLLLLKGEGTLKSTSHKPFGLNPFAIRNAHSYIICCPVFWRLCCIQPNQLQRSNLSVKGAGKLNHFTYKKALKQKSVTIFRHQTHKTLITKGCSTTESWLIWAGNFFHLVEHTYLWGWTTSQSIMSTNHEWENVLPHPHSCEWEVQDAKTLVCNTVL